MTTKLSLTGAINELLALEEEKYASAYIIGNGTSRQGFDLNTLKGQGIIIGCNALYREFEPDILIAIDDGIVSEIKGSNFPQEKFYVPPVEQQYEPVEVNPYRPRSNAGMNAMMYAIEYGYKELFMVGFDFIIVDKSQSTSNLFHGSKHYGPETRASYEDNNGRLNYFKWLAKKHSDVHFYFAFPREYGTKYSFMSIGLPNVYGTWLDVLNNKNNEN